MPTAKITPSASAERLTLAECDAGDLVRDADGDLHLVVRDSGDPGTRTAVWVANGTQNAERLPSIFNGFANPRQFTKVTGVTVTFSA